MHLYRHGDLAKYTGTVQKIYGGLFYEVIFLEGTRKGKKEWTQKSPQLAPCECWITKDEMEAAK